MHAISDQAATESADFEFIVKENATGIPSILLETREGGLTALGEGFLVLELREGISLRQAKEIAQQLNDNIARVTHTSFGGTR